MSEENQFKYWQLTEEELLTHFNVTREGLTSQKAEEILKEVGPNELEEEEKESILQKIWEQFQDTLVRILLGAAVISFIIAITGDGSEGISAYIEPFVILLILIANATIGVWQDLNADKAIEALNQMQASHSMVIRNGTTTKINASELVPGDIVTLKEGDKVPADIRLIEINTATFQCNQANFTGETKLSYKNTNAIIEESVVNTRNNTVFSSCGVACGDAIGIVVATGKNAEIGKIHTMISEAKDDKSPLKIKLEQFGNALTYIIGIICVVVWIINYKNFFDEQHGSWVSGCIYYFKISVALAVAAIPEGLPAVITTCLALGTKRMSKNNAIIRKLHSIETLGCTSVICSDKTGTLTTNNMSVTKCLLFTDKSVDNCRINDIEGVTFDPKGKINGITNNDFKSNKNYELFLSACALCNMASIVLEKGKYNINGTSTEGALKVMVEKFGNYDDGFARNETDLMSYNNYLSNRYQKLYTLEFDRERKSMSVIALDKNTNKPVLLLKGAVEYLINNSNSIYGSNQETIPINEEFKSNLRNKLSENFMRKGLRTLGICVKEDLPELNHLDIHSRASLNSYFKDRENIINLENNCTLIGVTGMMDPPRPGVKEAIKVCHEAGIRVIMITGDERETAQSIGLDIGILDEANNQNCWYTNEFFKLSRDEMLNILKNEPKLIFARSEPRHKMQLVKLLKELNYITAMTGDGVNDAPALAEANIGIAMGITGTEVHFFT